MIAFVLWLYGVLAIASLIMVVAWGDAALELWRDWAEGWWALRWCKAFVIAAGLTVHAIAMTLACSYRAWDILRNGRVELGSEAAVQVMLLTLLTYSKVMFVWAGSSDDRQRVARWPWWAFLYVMMLWAVACGVWGAAPV